MDKNEDVLERLAAVIESRKGMDSEKSYVAKLFKKGPDGFLKKVGEEACETVMAAKDADPKRLFMSAQTFGFILS